MYSRGRRGAPAKGVGRVTGARVQISPSPPNKKATQSGGFFVWRERFERERRRRGREKNRPLAVRGKGRFFEWQPPRERNRANICKANSEGGENGWRQRCDAALVRLEDLSISANKKGTFVYQKFLFCLSKPQAWHIIAARSAVHIIKGGKPPLYLITRQRASTCGLMIYNAPH